MSAAFLWVTLSIRWLLVHPVLHFLFYFIFIFLLWEIGCSCGLWRPGRVSISPFVMFICLLYILFIVLIYLFFCLFMGTETLHIVTWNVNGLNNPTKRTACLDYLHRQQVDLAFIQ